MILLALGITLAVAAMLWIYNRKVFALTLGDTDDAMRLVMMRTLADGGGWYDQHILRLQPPIGVYMHWSRLIDGCLALLRNTFMIGMSKAQAEVAVRILWPDLWIFPTVLATLGVARRFGAGAAVFACGLILVSDLALYVQYRPGRVDHHSLQIAFCMIALAAAVQPSQRRLWAAVAGAATGLGLAVGLEGLVFEAVIGAAIALRFALDPKQARAALAYAGGLAAATVLAFLAQTPPWRWTVVACDSLGFNLTAAIATAAVGLALAVTLTARQPLWVRVVALGLAGVAALAVCLGLDPHCRGGWDADVDPRIKPIWMNNVQEVRTWIRLARADMEQAITLAIPCILGIASWLWLSRDAARRRDADWWLMGVCLAAAVMLGAGAVRMTSYAEWFAAPLIAAAAADITRRYAKGLMLPAAVIALIASPIAVTGATLGVRKLIFPPKPAAPSHGVADHCFETAPYADLARDAPKGLVLSEVDLGPMILANTPHSTVAAPYHRMSWGILAAREANAAPADNGAEAVVRRLGVTYVLECRAHSNHSDRDGMISDSLMKRLDAGKPPSWLEPLSGPKASLQVYRVKPAAPPKG